MSATPYLLLEINAPEIWQWSFFVKKVQMAQRYGFQGIIIHQQSLFARLAPLSSQCSTTESINLALARENAIIYLRKVGNYCNQHHLQLWLQGEATPSSQELKDKLPEFFRSQNSQNNESGFIQHFFQFSIPQILSDLPDVRGVRLSLSTPDISDECWRSSLQTLYQGIRLLGRQLVLRDYRDKTWPRHMLYDTLEALPSDVRASVKATELDYRPGFANNPNLLNIQGRRKWLELDLWGLEYGWTLLPCYLLEEIQQRLLWLSQYPDSYPEAISVRIDWEWLPDLALSGSLNELNLFGLSHLILNAKCSPRQLVDQWLQQRANTPLRPELLTSITDIIVASHQWSCKTPNLLGRIMQCHSQLPVDFEHALHLLHLDTRSANWAQSFQPLMPTDDPELGEQQYQLIQLESQRSHYLANYMHSRSLKLLPESPLNDEIQHVITTSTARALKYTHIYNVFTQAFTLKLFMRKYGKKSDIHSQFIAALHDFNQQNNALKDWLHQHSAQHPWSFETLLNTERISILISSLEHD